jgi:hypothetical protein
MTPGLGTRKAGQLIEIFRSPQAIFRASRSEPEVAALSASVTQSISSGCAFDDVVTQRQKLIEHRTTLIPLPDPRYPPRYVTFSIHRPSCSPAAVWICSRV